VTRGTNRPGPAPPSLRGWRALAVLCLLAVAAPAGAAEPEVHRRVLANGLTLLMVERHEAPVVSAVITVRVGAVDEPAGETGIAHMFEHMAFKGTAQVGTRDAAREAVLLKQVDALVDQRERRLRDGAPESDLSDLEARIHDLEARAKALSEPNAYANLYLRQGAEGLNASTGYDVTSYYVSLPANRLPFWAAMEYDRLAHPVLREFYTERDVVAEERRMRVDANPTGRLWENFLATAFVAHPYGHPVLGWPSDLAHLTRPEAEAFYRSRYVPSRMVVALVGDLDPDATLALVEKTLGRLPARPGVPSPPTREPEPQGPRRVVVYADAEPFLAVGYLRPPAGDPADAAFEVLDEVLGGGRVGRLYRSLVLQRFLATQASTGSGPGDRFSSLFVVTATPRHPNTPALVEAAVLDEVERVRTEPITERELERARNQVQAGVLRQMEDNNGLARSLAYAEAVVGDWHYPFDLAARIGTLTPEDVRKVAARYLAPERRVVGELLRAPAGAEPEAPAPEAAP